MRRFAEVSSDGTIGISTYRCAYCKEWYSLTRGVYDQLKQDVALDPRRDKKATIIGEPIKEPAIIGGMSR